MKNQTKSKILAFLCLSIFISSNLFSQSAGRWKNNSNVSSNIRALTDSAAGIGTLTPRGFTEIQYCPPSSSDITGLLITKLICIAPSTGGVSVTDPFNSGGESFDTSGTNQNTQFTNPVDLRSIYKSNNLTPFIGNYNPLFWARTETLGSINTPPTPGSDFLTKFIVLPTGRTGINIVNPRAAIDVVVESGNNLPVAIFGTKALGTSSANIGSLSSFKTRHISIVPFCTKSAYNRMTQNMDIGMFFTDGAGMESTNLNAGLIIAPFNSENDSIKGGLRISSNGDVQVGGELKSTMLKVRQRWWGDFVFEKDYLLPDLNYLKSFIKLNKHLPGFESNATILKEGVDIGETIAKQQVFIEELLLQIIKINEELEKQKNEIANLKKN